jgi:4-amino-4-deoxy-L-arabinose transferase-like glycosyltransferase
MSSASASGDVPASTQSAWSWALAHPAEHSWVCVLILLAMSGCLFFFGITEGELWRTESLRAIIGQEMLRSGNWIVPRLYGEPLFTKPPGMYIAIALASWPFGAVSEWTARLPSAVAATVTVLLFFWYFRRQLGRAAGLIAAIVLPMSPMWIDKASLAEIDMLQVMWVTGSILFFLRATEDDEATARRDDGVTPPCRTSMRSSGHPVSASGRWFWWLAALLFVAGGFLTKWTAPAFFYLTIVPFLGWRGQLHVLWSRYHIVSAALALAACCAWIGAAVYQEGWDIFYETVSREALHRLVPNYQSHRPYPWMESLWHPFRLLLTTLPWSALALVSLSRPFLAAWDEKGRRLLLALHCWTWPNILLWSLMSEHTPRHSFPLFPGIAGLAAMVWAAWYQGKLPWALPNLRPAQVVSLALALWLVIKTTFVVYVVPLRNANREPRAKGQSIAAIVPPGATLYLFRLKDEGIMFYYGRTVVRLPSPADLPSSGEPMYCILNLTEWEQWNTCRRTEPIARMTDEQGARIFLVRVDG